MNTAKIPLFCRIDPPISQQTAQRLEALNRLGLLEAIALPVLDEVTQMVARFLEVPICVLSVFDADTEYFQAAIGLSRLGLMNPLAASRQLPREQSLGTLVLDSCQVCNLPAATTHPLLQNNFLIHQYGIQSYLGVPLFDSQGTCLGTLAVMDQTDRTFTQKDIEFLELEARWCLGEVERHWLVQELQGVATARLNTASTPVTTMPEAEGTHSTASPSDNAIAPKLNSTTQQAAQLARVELITQLTHELRTPLTSIMGMTSVLSRKIYGTLTEKQEEYLEVMRDSGQSLLSLVDEITELGQFDAHDFNLDLAPVDIEMVCQQAVKSLNQLSQRHGHELALTVEPGSRIWLLDKDKVRQMLYHLVFTVINCTGAEGTIRIHVSRKQERLQLAVWVANPWLSGNFSSLEINPELAKISAHLDPTVEVTHPDMLTTSFSDDKATAKERRDRLAVLLCCELANLHGGEVLVQGSAEKGVRYVISLPAPTGSEEATSATTLAQFA